MNEIEPAVDILRSGRLVAFATETVYGLGADATSSTAVQKIFAAKGRPSTNPLIVHVSDAAVARRYTTAWPAVAEQLANAFWPGPLTLVLSKAPSIVTEVTAGLQTVGLRVPNHPLALELLNKFGGAVAAPSADRANHISPTSAADVKAELGDKVDLILDGGPCVVGIESTVIDLTTTPPRILRPGGISRQQIEQIIGPVDFPIATVESATPAQSPGQQARHYSPITPAFWFERAMRDRVPPQPNAALLMMEQNADQNCLTMPREPVGYARQLYHTLREIDSRGYSAILIELPPNEPQWLAVRDRLTRAATPLFA